MLAVFTLLIASSLCWAEAQSGPSSSHVDDAAAKQKPPVKLQEAKQTLAKKLAQNIMSTLTGFVILSSFDIVDNPDVLCDDNSACDLELSATICVEMPSSIKVSSQRSHCYELETKQLPSDMASGGTGKRCIARSIVSLDELPPECAAWKFTMRSMQEAKALKDGNFELIVSAQDYEGRSGGANDDLLIRRNMTLISAPDEAQVPRVWRVGYDGECDVDSTGGHSKKICNTIKLHFGVYLDETRDYED